MSRFFRYAAVLMSACIVLAGCSKDNTNPEPEPKPEPPVETPYDIDIEATNALGVYYSYEELMGDLSNYYMTMADITIDGEAEHPIFDKAGNAILLDMYVVATEKGFLPVGTYDYITDENADPTPSTFSMFSGYMKIGADGMPYPEEPLVFSEAELEVSADADGVYTIELTAILEDGRTLRATYIGELVFESPTANPEDLFPPMIENTQTTFIDHSAYYYGQTDQDAGFFELSLSDFARTGFNESGRTLTLKMFSTGNDKVLAAGTYTVASAYDEPETYGANMLQPGFINTITMQNLGCSIMKTENDGENISEFYGIVASGTVTVAKAADSYTITVDLVDKNGYTIKGSYSGVLNINDKSYYSTLDQDHEAFVAGMPCEIEYYGQSFSDKGIDSDHWTAYISSAEVGKEGLIIDLLAPHSGFAGKLPAGTYNVTGEYMPNSYMCLPGEYDKGDLYCSWWLGGLEGSIAMYVAPFVSGTVTISKSGESYTISLNVKDDAPTANTITGTWIGVPEFADYSQPSSSSKAKSAFKTTKRNYADHVPFRTNLKKHRL